MEKMKTYDVVLIGAGSAGLFAAEKLAGAGLSVLVADRGEEPSKRTDMNFGIGGAGTYSDGKLNLTYRIGGEPESFNRTPDDIQEYIEEIDALFTQLGVDGGYSGDDSSGVEELRRLANSAGIDFIYGRQRHIGTDRLHDIIDNFYKRLQKRQIEFSKNTRILKIQKEGDLFHLVAENKTLQAKSVIAAPGRAGSFWLREQAHHLGIATAYGPIDVGVRVEFPAVLYSKIAEVMYDAKFRLYTRSYDDLVRTFCTNPNGYIVKESFDNFVLVNGHARRDSKTENTNFALLTRVRLTDPVEDTTSYGRDIARLATTIGGGKPIAQRLQDFLNGRRSSWSRITKMAITPTMTDVTPGDIAMAFPYRIVMNLAEALGVLDKVIPGLNSSNTLLYAPEIKFYDTKYNVSSCMETSVPNFFVAGDASGHSRGIVYAAVTGMAAAEGVIQNLK